MHYLSLTNSDKRVRVDKEDYDRLKYKRWSYYKDKNQEIIRESTNLGKSIRTLIISHSPNNKIYLKNGDPFDVRKNNLTFCFPNIKRKKTTKIISKYNGVYWHSTHKRWNVVLHVLSKMKHIGLFDDDKEAAIAYDNFVKENSLNKQLNFS